MIIHDLARSNVDRKNLKRFTYVETFFFFGTTAGVVTALVAGVE
jgi:hypothetical protein